MTVEFYVRSSTSGRLRICLRERVESGETPKTKLTLSKAGSGLECNETIDTLEQDTTEDEERWTREIRRRKMY